MISRRRAARWLAGLGCGALLVAGLDAAWAFVPDAARIARAVADSNSAAGRSQALRFALTLRIDGGDVLATGELLTHPSGLARLELRGAKGLVERHLLLGTEHSASRNGRPLAAPRAFLPPLFFIQAGSGTSLRAALEAYQIDPDLVGLAPCGDQDCFVIGDPRRVAPRPQAVPELPAGEAVPEPEWEVETLPTPEPEDELLLAVAPVPAALWIETQSYRVLELELVGGVTVELGPPLVQNKVEVPQWFEVMEPDRRPVRFDFQRVTAVTVPARAFSEQWLFAGEGGEE